MSSVTWASVLLESIAERGFEERARSAWRAEEVTLGGVSHGVASGVRITS